MRLLEYEAKNVFAEFKIPLVNRIVIMKGEDVQEKVDQFSFPAIVKSQIAIGSRKKAGLIKIVQTRDEALSLCKEYFTCKIGNYEVEAILLEALADIKHEYYCSIALDTSGRQFVLIASAEGGIDIEEVAATRPEAIIKETISLTEGLSEGVAKSVAERLGFADDLIPSATDLFLKLWQITVKKEAQLAEINPLVLTPQG